MKKRCIPAFLLIVLAYCSCDSQDHAASPVGSKYDFSAVDRFVQDNLTVYDGHVAIMVAQHGQVIYQREINMDIHTERAIASASKWLSAGVIMSLVDSHQLSLDDTVGKYLPIFSQYGKGGITVRQLFSLTAGFASDIGDSDLADKYEYRKDLPLAQVVDSIAVYEPLVNPPGHAFNYCSTSMQIAGRIAEIVSGTDWQTLFDERIGDPCQMTARYTLMSAENPLVAGGVRTSAADYLHFLEMIVNKGSYDGVQVLSEAAVDTMGSDQTRGAEIQHAPYPANPYAPIPVSPVRYGIGNWIDVLDSAGHAVETSSPGLFGTHPWQDKKHDIAGIIFTSTVPRKSNAISLQIRQMIRNIVDTTK